MHASWKSWSATGLALVAVTDKVFAHQDNNRHIRRLEKDYQVLRGRDSTCTSGWSLCAASNGGDCCPNGYECASTYCYKAAASATTACGLSGYVACGIEMPGIPNTCLQRVEYLHTNFDSRSMLSPRIHLQWQQLHSACWRNHNLRRRLHHVSGVTRRRLLSKWDGL